MSALICSNNATCAIAKPLSAANIRFKRYLIETLHNIEFRNNNKNEKTNLTGTEKDLRMAETIFILIANKILHNVCTRYTFIIVTLAGIAQQKVSIEEILVCPARWEASRRYANSFEYATCS